MSLYGAELLAKLRRIKYSIASTGLRRGLSDIATHFLAYKPEHDHAFDQEFGTDTAGSVQPDQLGIVDPALRERAILYLPSPPRVTRWMLDQIGVPHRDFSFVDLGCGKGRVLLVASEYPFQCVVGVEISPELSEIARNNAAAYQSRTRKCRDIEVVTGDATTFHFPETDILLHLYHPFEPEVTRAVLAHLDKLVQEKPRRVAVAYLTYAAAAQPVEEVFAGFPFLKKTRYEQSILGHYNWLFYSN